MRVSGPLLDRFDLVVDVPPVDLRALVEAAPGECSEDVRRRVVQARERQRARFGPRGPSCNAQMGPADLARHAQLGPAPLRLLRSACERLGVSARSFDRIRRVARSLADLDGAEVVEPPHIAEAVQYRFRRDPFG